MPGASVFGGLRPHGVGSLGRGHSYEVFGVLRPLQGRYSRADEVVFGVLRPLQGRYSRTGPLLARLDRTFSGLRPIVVLNVFSQNSLPVSLPLSLPALEQTPPELD